MARATLPVADGDAFLSFRAKGGAGANKSYIVNIGPVTQFTTATGLVNVDLGSAGGGSVVTDLIDLFGEDWKTRTDVVWSVHAVNYDENADFTSNTMFATRAEPSPGVKSPTWPSISLFAAGSPSGQMLQLRNAYANGAIPDKQILSGSSPKALIQNPNAESSYASFMPGGTNTDQGTAFSWFNATSGIENSFANGTTASVLDFYKLVPGGGTPTHLGGFRLNNSAQLVFSTDISFFTGPAQAKFTAPADSVSETDASGKITVTITRIGNTSTAFTLNLSTADGTAVAGTDYVAQANTPVVFAASETTKTVDIAVLNRSGFQGNRGFTASIALTSGAAEIVAPSTIEITIIESTPEPAILTLSTGAYTVAENAAPGNVTVTVNRTGGTNALTVNLSSQDGTATAGVDYTAQTNTPVNFAVGETTQTVNVPIINRAGFQGDRSFTVSLSNPTNDGVLGTPNSATVTIEENEANPAGTIAFSAATYGFTTGDTTVITLNRSLGATGAVSADISPALGGTLTPGEDFTITPTTIAFDDGVTTATVTVQFTAAAAPLPGSFNLQLGNAQGGASIGTPNIATVNVSAQQVTLVSGNYTGLVIPTGSAPPAGDLHNASGLLTAKVLPTGNFTGKVLVGGATLPFAGKFNADGTASFKPGSTPTITLVKKGKAPVTFGALTLTFGNESISGSIGDIATFVADRAPFDGRTNLVDAKYLENKGKYTSVLPSKPQTVLIPSEFPQGDGIGNITITKQGKFTFKGKLADGTPVSMSGLLSADYHVPLYAALYAKKGSIGGIVALDDTQTDSDLEGTDFLWLRPAQSKAKHYPTGWPAGVKIDLLGAGYVATKIASALPNLGPEDSTAGNAEFQLADGKLDTAITKSVNVSTKNKVTNVPVDKNYKVTIAAPKGSLSGFFTHSDTKKTSFKGIIYQKGPNAGGFGYFLSAVPKNAPSGESGGVTLIAK